MAQVVSEDFTVARDGLTVQGHVEYPQGSTHDRVVICMHGFLRDMVSNRANSIRTSAMPSPRMA